VVVKNTGFEDLRI